MKKVRAHPIFVSPLSCLTAWTLGSLLFASAGLLRGDQPLPAEPPPYAAFLPDPASGKPSAPVAFLTKKTRLWLGRTQVICFYAQDKPDEDRYFSFAADENFLHVLIPPMLAPGAQMGYVRVRPVKEGHTQLTLAGATIALDIVKDTAASTLESTRPEIVAPTQSAVVWGKFAVGVERLNLSTAPPPPAPVLRLSDGREIEAQNVPDQQPGPYLRYAFTVDTQSLRPGPNELVAVFKDGPGKEIVSDPLDIVVHQPNPASIMAGDCKDLVKTHWPLPKIPFGFPTGEFQPLPVPSVVADDQSGSGSVVSLPGENPWWSLPVTVPTRGLYQLMVTARGRMGGNALPTLALIIDGAPNPATTARLATTEWQRIPVGHPVALEAGEHVLGIRFRNAFNSVEVDRRQVFLARYELAALDQSPAPALAATGSGGPMMQQVVASAGDLMPPPMAATASMQSGNDMQAKAAGSMMQEAAMQGAAPMQGSMSAQSMMQVLIPYGSFHIVFRDVLEQQVIANQVQINAMCWWPDREHTPPPTVDLLVNGKIVATETSPRPRFRIGVEAFRPGANKIQLQGTLPNGQHAQSTVENLVLPAGLNPGSAPYRPGYKFYVYDPAWAGSLDKRIQPINHDAIAVFAENGDAGLKLPETLQGPSKVSIELRGDDFNGPAVATVLLQANGQETKLGEIPAGANLATLPVAQTTFAAGPKTLIVRYANDAYEKGKGDRNLYVHSVQIDPVSVELVKTPPLATIVYPSPGAKMGWADAVVANVSSAQGVVQCDLVIDGQAQHLNLRASNGMGPVLFPLLTRGLAPGAHQVQIAVKDDSGNAGQSEAVKIVATGKEEGPEDTYSRAVFLLNRFGYGPEPRELASILTQGPAAWLAARLNESVDSPTEENERERVHAEFPDTYALVPRALSYLLTDANPVRARFVMWTENHFSTWANKDGTEEKSREHDRFVELGIAPFSDLLLASATSPAMLIYLDQRYSSANRLNENYAREIMELHTLGVKGGYTQKDVTTLADLLTGWTLADEAPADGSENLIRTFRYNPYLNSGNAERILGMEFPGVSLDHRFDRVLTALNMLSAHPSCAIFISRKLIEHYVSDPAPPALVNDLAKVYLESGGDLRDMLQALAQEPAFWSAPAKVASPIDFSIRLARLAGLNNPGPVNELLSHSGMGLFDRATPDGYPEADGYFTSSNALLQRWHFAQEIQNSFLLNGLIPDGWKPAEHHWDAATTQRLVDLAAVRITGNVLGADSNTAALQLIASAPDNTDGRLQLLTTFLCQTPETSLR